MSRNYVIINGTNSLTLQGLAINILPPISKPLMRTIREEIDGRNGDINTKLGYQAYDKQLEIGLFGTFDINAIIKFFDSEGTIVFSDESDKYYNFQILDKIDFARLVKFRTAVVNIHCQPFKYPLTNTPVSLSSGNNTITNQGNVYSKPLMTLSGTGTLSVSLNGSQMFSIDMTGLTSIAIDTELMEAYDPNNGNLLNRRVTGDYSKFQLDVGANTITLSATTIGTCTIENITRWL